MDKQTYNKIIQKKEFSQLPKKDVEKVYLLFDKKHFIEDTLKGTSEKIKKTRDMLRKIYFAFGSLKLLTLKILDKKSVGDILKKHISTRERFEFYGEIYNRLLEGFEGCSIIDLGAGINGLSYNHFPSGTNYLGVEAVGQLVDLMNVYFQKNKLKAKAIHESLFELGKIKEIVIKEGHRSVSPKVLNSGGKKPQIVFLFKTLDSLEMVERNYSKKLLKEIVPIVDRVIVSFATRSLISRKKFNVRRFWFENFVKEMGWKVLQDFELGGERYILFKG